MGIFDFLKRGKTNPVKIVDASWELVVNGSADKIKGLAEVEAKKVMKGVAKDVVNEQIDATGNIPSGYLRDKLVKKCVGLCVDRAWDKLKNQ